MQVSGLIIYWLSVPYSWHAAQWWNYHPPASGHFKETQVLKWTSGLLLA